MDSQSFLRYLTIGPVALSDCGSHLDHGCLNVAERRKLLIRDFDGDLPSSMFDFHRAYHDEDGIIQSGVAKSSRLSLEQEAIFS